MLLFYRWCNCCNFGLTLTTASFIRNNEQEGVIKLCNDITVRPSFLLTVCLAKMLIVAGADTISLRSGIFTLGVEFSWIPESTVVTGMEKTISILI